MTVPQMIVRMLILVLLLLAVLFISAGTVDWPMAWVYVAITVILTAGSRLLLARHSPDLVAERAASVGKADAKPWDRLLMPIVAIYGPLLILIVAGLDRRFGWTSGWPLWAGVAGAILLILANLLGLWAMLANRFFSGIVRIQHDRGHVVVSSGPYRWLRHPGYAGGVIGNLAVPLLLGSLWAFIPAVLAAGIVVLRTALEDRTLQAELPGYRAYAQQTRYRLLPGVW